MKLRDLVLYAVFLSMFILPGGCGKKAPPFLPKAKETFPLQVEGLEAREQQGELSLSGTVILPRDRRGKAPVPQSCRVYHVRYAADNPPCDGCPISFATYKEMKPHIAGDGRFQCDTGLKKVPGMYYFMVRLVDPGGLAGPPSNTATLLVK